MADRFEDNCSHLLGVVYRILGSLSEADDAVQEAWLRLNRADTSGVQNLDGWLTTVVDAFLAAARGGDFQGSLAILSE